MRQNNLIMPIILKLQKIRFGKNCRFFGISIIVSSKSEIIIGDSLILASGFLTNLIGLYQRSIICARNGGNIIIGDHVSMSGVTVYAFKHIEIGDYCIIGANTKIVDSDFHPINPDIRLTDPNNKEHTTMKEVIIGKNCFIGCNCLILKGVHIGDNAVIGAGSVVTKDVESNTIVAGNPAVFVKRM